MAPLVNRISLRKLLCLALIAPAGLPVRGAGAQATLPTLEYKVKAAYLLNFTRYVEWPAQAFAAPDSPIQICILGADPFGTTLEKTTAGRSSKGRRIEIRRHARINAGLLACHVVFLSKSESRQAGALLAMLRENPVLTVGESAGFLDPGGIINLKIASGNVHFEVNSIAAERAGLKISSRLLTLAKGIISEGGERN